MDGWMDGWMDGSGAWLTDEWAHVARCTLRSAAYLPAFIHSKLTSAPPWAATTQPTARKRTT
jgi:hypothetical protein